VVGNGVAAVVVRGCEEAVWTECCGSQAAGFFVFGGAETRGGGAVV